MLSLLEGHYLSLPFVKLSRTSIGLSLEALSCFLPVLDLFKENPFLIEHFGVLESEGARLFSHELVGNDKSISVEIEGIHLLLKGSLFVLA